jgi:hypothetical protein
MGIHSITDEVEFVDTVQSNAFIFMQKEQNADDLTQAASKAEQRQAEAPSSSSISCKGSAGASRQHTLTRDGVHVLLRATKEEAVSTAVNSAGVDSTSAGGESSGIGAEASSKLRTADLGLSSGLHHGQAAELAGEGTRSEKQPDQGKLEDGAVDEVPAEEVEAGLKAAYAQLMESNLQLLAESKQAAAEATSLRKAAAEVAMLRDAQQGWEVEKAALQAQLAAAMKGAESAAAALGLEEELQNAVVAKDQLTQQLQQQMYASQAMQEQFMQQLEEVSEVKAQLETQLSEARDKEGQLQQHLDEATQALEQLHVQLANEHSQKQLQLEEQLRDAVQGRHQLQQQLAGLQQDNASLEEQLLQIEELETQLALLRQEQHQLHRENEQLLAKLAMAEAELLAMKESHMLGLQVPVQEVGLSLAQAAASVQMVRAATESLIGRSPEVRTQPDRFFIL